MFTIGDHILGIQGHPEYTKDILNNLMIGSSITLHRERLRRSAKLSLETAEPDRQFLGKDLQELSQDEYN
ncbi:hypothetical protein HHK36_032262 [Tetracentron sinense]|uniref:Glutamine amidotransferase domain-containing protein n=1 Tax=Tetracentron sinense TaxID=13715 RepID=A0A834Y8F4_TETSI|nr:hypothetical protein HHK36_032262 [Tetracentron sinense]